MLPNRHQPCKFSVPLDGARRRAHPRLGIPLDSGSDRPSIQSLNGWMLLLVARSLEILHLLAGAHLCLCLVPIGVSRQQSVSLMCDVLLPSWSRRG